MRTRRTGLRILRLRSALTQISCQIAENVIHVHSIGTVIVIVGKLKKIQLIVKDQQNLPDRLEDSLLQ
jgi:hypothetical protein